MRKKAEMVSLMAKTFFQMSKKMKAKLVSHNETISEEKEIYLNYRFGKKYFLITKHAEPVC